VRYLVWHHCSMARREHTVLSEQSSGSRFGSVSRLWWRREVYFGAAVTTISFCQMALMSTAKTGVAMCDCSFCTFKGLPARLCPMPDQEVLLRIVGGSNWWYGYDAGMEGMNRQKFF
jgi:hypothetical protein